jgi:hypothetical protein
VDVGVERVVRLLLFAGVLVCGLAGMHLIHHSPGAGAELAHADAHRALATSAAAAGIGPTLPGVGSPLRSTRHAGTHHDPGDPAPEACLAFTTLAVHGLDLRSLPAVIARISSIHTLIPRFYDDMGGKDAGPGRPVGLRLAGSAVRRT